jgi:ABC-type multidrug transport system fused ATPase/permease subunit
VYDEKDIIILDENLSEVDDKVDRKILRRWIKDKLKGKKNLLVNNGIKLIEECDEVL